MFSEMYIGLHVKYPLFLSDFNETWILSTDFSKNPQISHFMKIRPMWAEFHADGQTVLRMRLKMKRRNGLTVPNLIQGTVYYTINEGHLDSKDHLA
jgi:hypothetical protein